MLPRVNPKRDYTVDGEKRKFQLNRQKNLDPNFLWNETSEGPHEYSSYEYDFKSKLLLKTPITKEQVSKGLVGPKPASLAQSNIQKRYSPQYRKPIGSPLHSPEKPRQLYSDYRQTVRPKKFDYQNHRRPIMQKAYNQYRRGINDENFAAAKIQAAFRGYKTRKDFWKERELYHKRADRGYAGPLRTQNMAKEEAYQRISNTADPNLNLLPPTIFYEDRIKDQILRDVKGITTFSEDIPTAAQFEDEVSSTLVLLGGINPREPKNYALQAGIFIFNIRKNKWFYGGSMPAARCYHTAVLLDGRIYVIGGFDSLSSSANKEMIPTNTVFQFSVRSKRWRGRCNMLNFRAYHGSCAVGKNNIMVIGGQDKNEQLLSTVEMYDAEKDQWSFLKSLPEPLLGMAVAQLDECIFVIGGMRKSRPAAKCVASDQVYSFDFTNQEWNRRRVLPHPQGFCAAVTVHREIWVWGGVREECTEDGCLISSDIIMVYNSTKNNWELPGNIITAKHCIAVAKAADRRIFLLGGMSSQRQEALSEIDIYDRFNDSFAEGASLPRPVTGCAVVALPPKHSDMEPRRWFTGEENVEDLAATRIQAVFRGHRVRQKSRTNGAYPPLGVLEKKVQRTKVFNRFGSSKACIEDNWRKYARVVIQEWPPTLDPNSSASNVNLRLGGEPPGYTVTDVKKDEHSVLKQIKRYNPLDYDVDPNIGLVGFLDNLYKKTRSALGLRRMDPLPFFAHDLETCHIIQDDSVHVIILLGGLQPRDPLNYSYGKTVLRYHPLKDRWQYVGLLPEPRNYHAAAYLDKHIYMTGGCNPDVRNTGEMVASNMTFAMDMERLDWQRKADMICARAFHSMVVYDKKLYVAGGRDQNGRLVASIEMYNPQVNQWTILHGMEFGRMGMAAVVFDDRMWCLGGIGPASNSDADDENVGPVSHLSVLTTVSSYVFRRDSWERRRPLRCPRAFATCVEVNKELWLCAGCCRLPQEKFLVSMAAIDAYDPDAVEWRRKTVISNPRHGAAITAVEDCIYIFGGISSQEWSAQFRNEMVIASDHSIHNCKDLPIPLTGAAAVTIPPEAIALRPKSLACLIHSKLTT